jgi:hypothetical protein
MQGKNDMIGSISNYAEVCMYSIRIELHVNKHLFFLTNHLHLAKLIRSKEFVLVTSPSGGFEATLIDFDLKGYRKSVNIETWLQLVEEEGFVGPFVLAYGYITKGKLLNCEVHSCGFQSELQRFVFMDWLSEVPTAIEDESGNLFKISVGKTTLTLSQLRDDYGVNLGPVSANMQKEVAATRPNIVEVTVDRPFVDPFFEKAVANIIEKQQASVSFLQRKQRIGYTRAARFIDQMEDLGIVGPYEGSKPRHVLLKEMPDLYALISMNEVKSLP